MYSKLRKTHTNYIFDIKFHETIEGQYVLTAVPKETSNNIHWENMILSSFAEGYIAGFSDGEKETETFGVKK